MENNHVPLIKWVVNNWGRGVYAIQYEIVVSSMGYNSDQRLKTSVLVICSCNLTFVKSHFKRKLISGYQITLRTLPQRPIVIVKRKIDK